MFLDIVISPASSLATVISWAELTGHVVSYLSQYLTVRGEINREGDRQAPLNNNVERDERLRRGITVTTLHQTRQSRGDSAG